MSTIFWSQVSRRLAAGANAWRWNYCCGTM